MNLAYRRACMEVLQILKRTEYGIIEKIPLSYLKFLKENRDKDYIVDIDFNNEHWIKNISKEAGIILSKIYLEYVVEEKAKAVLKKVEEFNREKILEDKQEEPISNLRKQENRGRRGKPEVSIMVVKKQNWYKKFIGKIKDIFNFKTKSKNTL